MRVYIKYDSDDFSYPEDMKKILSYLRNHGELCVSAPIVESLYREFSAIRCAGWLFAADETIKEFADWLNETEV